MFHFLAETHERGVILPLVFNPKKKHLAIPCKLQETHEKMQCWCKTNGDEKANSIQEAQNHIKVCHGRREETKTLEMKP